MPPQKIPMALGWPRQDTWKINGIWPKPAEPVEPVQMVTEGGEGGGGPWPRREQENVQDFFTEYSRPEGWPGSLKGHRQCIIIKEAFLYVFYSVLKAFPEVC